MSTLFDAQADLQGIAGEERLHRIVLPGEGDPAVPEPETAAPGAPAEVSDPRRRRRATLLATTFVVALGAVPVAIFGYARFHPITPRYIALSVSLPASVVVGSGPGTTPTRRDAPTVRPQLSAGGDSPLFGGPAGGLERGINPQSPTAAGAVPRRPAPGDLKPAESHTVVEITAPEPETVPSPEHVLPASPPPQPAAEVTDRSPAPSPVAPPSVVQDQAQVGGIAKPSPAAQDQVQTGSIAKPPAQPAAVSTVLPAPAAGPGGAAQTAPSPQPPSAAGAPSVQGPIVVTGTAASRALVQVLNVVNAYGARVKQAIEENAEIRQRLALMQEDDDKHMTDLEQRVALLEAQGLLGQDAPRAAGQRATPRTATTNSAVSAAANPASAPNYVVSAAAPNMAVLYPDDGGPLKAVSVGDWVDPVHGKVTRIVQQGGSWVVATEAGVLGTAQPPAPRRSAAAPPAGRGIRH